VGHMKEALRRIVRLEKELEGYPLDANMFTLRSLSATLERAGFDVDMVQATHDFANIVAVRRGGT